MSDRRGLTVVEVLLAALICSLVAGAVYRVFAVAVTAQARVGQSLKKSTALLSAFDRLEKDIDHMVAYRLSKDEAFQGNRRRIAMVTATGDGLNVVSYEFDDGECLVRRQVKIGEFSKKEGKAPGECLLDIESMDFSFAYRVIDPKPVVVWKDSWHSDRLPFALRWTGRVWDDAAHRRAEAAQRTFYIFHGEWGIDEN